MSGVRVAAGEMGGETGRKMGHKHVFVSNHAYRVR